MKKLVFLGGTCGNNNWRDSFIKELVDEGIDENILFNPVVKNWTEEDQEKEEVAKKKASHFVFYLGSPHQLDSQLSAYSMVEATMALYDFPKTTVVIFDDADITGNALKSFIQTEKVLRSKFPDANIFSNVKDALDWLKSELTIDFKD